MSDDSNNIVSLSKYRSTNKESHEPEEVRGFCPGPKLRNNMDKIMGQLNPVDYAEAITLALDTLGTSADMLGICTEVHVVLTRTKDGNIILNYYCKCPKCQSAKYK